MHPSELLRHRTTQALAALKLAQRLRMNQDRPGVARVAAAGVRMMRCLPEWTLVIVLCLMLGPTLLVGCGGGDQDCQAHELRAPVQGQEEPVLWECER